jgi:subtilisin family serine protease
MSFRRMVPLSSPLPTTRRPEECSNVSFAVCAIALAVAFAGCSKPDALQRSVVDDRLLAAFDHDDEVDVIVSFVDSTPHRWLGDLDGHRVAIQSIRQAVLAANADGFVPSRHFNHIPAVAGRLARSALAALSRDPNVSFIQIDSPGQGALTVSVPAIGADVAKSQFHVTGKGVRVAVLDTGANSSHPDLKSSILPTQHCFTHSACPPSGTSEGTSAEDDHGHGSHVSGIITSDGIVAGAGFAPDAEIVPVKINDKADSGFASDWAAGFDWVFSNLATLNVKIVNASFGTQQLYGSAADCDKGEPALAKAVKNLVDAGVTLFVSSGNMGSSTQMGAPACNTGAIAVGATYKSNQGRQPTSGTYSSQWGSSFGDCADVTTAFDQVACFTNSGPRLDIVAPGAIIISDILGTKTEAYRGTSQASPTAAGVAALMLECNPRLMPSEIKDILIRTSVYVTDPKTGTSYPSLRASAAVKAVCATALDAGTDRDALVPDTSNADSNTDGQGSGDGIGGRDGSDGSFGGNAGSGGAVATGGTGTAGATAAAGGKSGSGGSATGGSAGGAAGTSVSGTVTTGGKIGTGGVSSSSGGAGGHSSLGGAGGSASTTTSAMANGKGCSCHAGAVPTEPGLAALACALIGLALVRHRRR